MDNIEANNTSKYDLENPYSTLAPLEDRLKVIANLIVDRMIEEQQKSSIQNNTGNK